MKKTFITSALALLLVFAASIIVMESTEGKTTPIARRQPDIKNMTAGDFRASLAKHKGIILDVRTPQEVRQGHIEGASFINFYDEQFKQKLQLIQKGQIIYVYCRSGNRSSKALVIMKKQGFQQIYNLLGGIGAWKDAGYPLVKPKTRLKDPVEELTINDLNATLQTTQPVLVQFHTQWCAPCRIMAPVIDRLQKEFKGTATVLKIDAVHSSKLAKTYGIKAVPVFLIFKNGKEIWRKTGLVDEDILRNKLKVNIGK